METSDTQEYKYAITFYLPDDPDKILHMVYYPEHQAVMIIFTLE